MTSDISNFPQRMVEIALADTERRLRLERVQAHGVKFASVCSGIDAAGEACRLLQAALAEVKKSAETWIVPSSFCDIGRAQQEFLKERLRSHPHSPCLFCAIEDRIPAHIQARWGPVPSFLEQGKGSKQEKEDKAAAVKFFKHVAAVLKSSAAETFSADAEAYCSQHHRCCKVRQTRDMPSSVPFPNDETKKENALLLSLGGLPCVAWSKVGLKRGSADPTELSFRVWVAERQEFAECEAEDIFIFENVVDFPQSKIKEELDVSHHIIVVKVDPQDWAWDR